MTVLYLAIGFFLTLSELKKSDRWRNFNNTAIFLSICLIGVVCFLSQALKYDILIYLMLSINIVIVLPMFKLDKLSLVITGLAFLCSWGIEKKINAWTPPGKVIFSYTSSGVFSFTVSILLIFICLLIVSHKGKD